jgi:hypothetical protein
MKTYALRSLALIVAAVIGYLPTMAAAQEVETIRVKLPGDAVPAVILKVPVRITNFHPTWNGEMTAMSSSTTAEIQCTLLDAAGNSIGRSMEYFVPSIVEGGSYTKVIEFEAVKHNDEFKDTPIKGYRCTMTKSLLFDRRETCATPAAGEGAVCTVTGALDLP